MKVMKQLRDGSVHMILCDLPYGTTQNKWDSIIPLNALWREYQRLCTGAVVLTASQPFTSILGASNIRALHHCWVWKKSKATGHLNARRMPMKLHEDILVFGSRFTYNMSTGKRLSANEPKNNGTESAILC